MAPLLGAAYETVEDTASKIDLVKPTLYILSDFHPVAVAYARTLFHCVNYDEPKALEWRKHATAILVKDYDITEADLMAAPQLRAIGKQGVGTEKIDTEAAARLGVRVFNTPGVNARCVAEMVMGLTFAVARDIPQLVLRQLGTSETIRKETCDGLLLTGKTIGIIGMGNIGRHVAQMFRGAFDAKVLAYDPYMPADTNAWDGIEHRRVHELNQVLDADVVTLHVPLTPSTRGLLSYKQFQAMRPNTIVINAARGGIINEDDLLKALNEGLIHGAGLDCHEQEPPTREKYLKLWSHPHVVGLPHCGAATSETQIATINAATDFVYQFMKSL
jgi:D-3-phosphoglycerate dehydrogenase